MNAGLSYRALQEWIYTLKNVVAVSAHLGSGMSGAGYIQPADRSGDFRPALKLVDPAFFRIYPLRFVDGNPFTDSDLESGIRTAVISDDLARRLFGSTDEVVGRSFTLDYIDYRVCGVVHGASYLTNESYAQVYLPYSVIPNYKKPLTERFPYCGQYNITFLVKDDTQADALRTEIKELTRRVNLEYKDFWSIDLWEQPTSHFISVFQEIPSDVRFSFWKSAGYLIVVVLVLLLVPGANKGALLSQVMWENLFLTVAGGIIGLIVAWTTVYLGREWIFTLLSDWPTATPEGANLYVSGEMLFAPAVFGIAFLLCLLLNLLSALLPAWMSLRKPIVYSLYEKR